MFILITHMPPGGYELATYLKGRGLLAGLICQKHRRNAFFSLISFTKWLILGLFGKAKSPKAALEEWYSLWQLKKSLGEAFVVTHDINSDSVVIDYLNKTRAKVALVLGGKIIKSHVLNAYTGCWINGHGGVLPYYRGLSSEYWALVNRDMESVGVTIHRLTEKIDCGDVYLIRKLSVDVTMSLEELIARNHRNLINAYKSFIELCISVDYQVANLKCIDIDWGCGGYYGAAPRSVDFTKICSDVVGS